MNTIPNPESAKQNYGESSKSRRSGSKYCADNPPEFNSPALMFGAVYKAVLEPDRLRGEYVILQNSTGGQKTARRDMRHSKCRLPVELRYRRTTWWLSVKWSRLFGDTNTRIFLTKGEVEMSYYWQDELTGIDCQARPDCFKIVDGRGIVVDLKTTDASTDSFRRDAIKYGYDMQAAMFIDACQKEYGIPCDFIFVAIEKKKTPPYMINILQADELMLKYGEDRFRNGAWNLQSAKLVTWYGYNGFSGIINNLSLPAWLAKEVE